jgi:pilus assembly protein CpaF
MIDITERIRRRALDLGALGGRVPANSGNRFPRPQSAHANASSSSTRPARLLSLADTPVYRVQTAATVPPEIVAQALASLSDRLEAEGPLAGSREALGRRIGGLLGEALEDLELRLSIAQQGELVERLLDELIGLGPLGILLRDATVTDIIVSGPEAVYVERRGRIQATDVTFRCPAHLMAVLERIAAVDGRRLEERQPLVDVRISDRVWANIVVPPLALDGPQVTVRKTACEPLTLERMVRQTNLSADMAAVLEVAARCRLNILISGVSGSGKTALLGALSEMIDPGERIVTVEDTAELHLLQRHVVRLESRPLSRLGRGETHAQQLLRNALRMRPDRIIIGELRGNEAIDLITAMNSGHDGVLSTLHAGSPGEALDRLESLISVGGPSIPARSYRAQVADAVDLVVQVEPIDGGLRRVTRITEVVGLENDKVATKDLFCFAYDGVDRQGGVAGSLRVSGPSLRFMARAHHYGLEDKLRNVLASRPGDSARVRGKEWQRT